MKISKEVKIGIVVVSAIAMFVFGYNFLKGRNIFSAHRVYYAVYDNINGLQESNPVVLNGFQVGQVLKSTLMENNSGKILVELSINNKELKIPSNSIAKIVSTDFLGAKAVELIIGDSPTEIQIKDTLTGEVEFSLTDEVGSEVVAIKNKTEHLITSIDSVVSAVKEVLNEKTKKNLIASFESINNVVVSFEKSSENIEKLLASENGKVVSILKNVESIAENIQSNNKVLTKVIHNFESISDSLAKANLTGTINNVNATLAQTSVLIEKMNKGEGSAGLLFKDDSLYRNVASASLNLDLLLQDLKAHPGKYINVSVFGKKDKIK